MGHLELAIFVICLCLALAKDTPDMCRICNTYVKCGILDVGIPECTNAIPCTEEQYKMCSNILTSVVNEECDRPGIFARPDSLEEYYSCLMDPKTFSFSRNESVCPSNRIFESSTAMCLSQEEVDFLEEAQSFVPDPVLSMSVCKNPGKHLNVFNCKMYYECDKNLKPKSFSCPTHQYFNGSECTTTKTPECMMQLKSIFEEQKSRGQKIAYHIKRIMHSRTPNTDITTSTTPTPTVFTTEAKNSSTTFKPKTTTAPTTTPEPTTEPKTTTTTPEPTTEPMTTTTTPEPTTEPMTTTTTPEPTTEPMTTTTTPERIMELIIPNTTASVISTTIKSRRTLNRKPTPNKLSKDQNLPKAGFCCPYAFYIGRNPKDCRKFYWCRPVYRNERLKYIPITRTCKDGKWFSNFYKFCVDFRPTGC